MNIVFGFFNCSQILILRAFIRPLQILSGKSENVRALLEDKICEGLTNEFKAVSGWKYESRYACKDGEIKKCQIGLGYKSQIAYKAKITK